MPTIDIALLTQIGQLSQDADVLDAKANTSKGHTKGDLRAQAQTMRNLALSLIAKVTVDLAGDPAALPNIAILNAELKRVSDVLKRIQKARDTLVLATKFIGFASALLSGQVPAIVAGFSALKDAGDKYATMYP
jgi:hypothetical protein